jgi:hypothetical protein
VGTSILATASIWPAGRGIGRIGHHPSKGRGPYSTESEKSTEVRRHGENSFVLNQWLTISPQYFFAIRLDYSTRFPSYSMLG